MVLIAEETVLKTSRSIPHNLGAAGSRNDLLQLQLLVEEGIMFYVPWTSLHV